jgi:nicotinate-nucleotide adenylyltransferase
MGRRGVSRSAGGRRVGLLGGTFDPPHIGHLWLAALAADSLGLDSVLFMPAARPPHKLDAPHSAASDRVEMIRRAIEAEPAFALSTIELGRPGPSFTVDSVDELLAAATARDELILIMAADSFAQTGGWREPKRLLSLVPWAIGPRPGTSLPDRVELRRRFGPDAERIQLLDGPSLDVSATEIRARVAAGLTIRYLVPRAVEELILERGLYRRADA